MKLALMLAALGALVAPAAAADMQVKAPVKQFVQSYSWSGIYLYGFGGYAADITTATVTMPGVGTLDIGGISSGVMLGGGLKALYQLGSSDWVVGVSGDIAWANLKASGAATAVNGFQALSLSNATNYMGCFCAQLGYAVDPKLLLSLSGGLGFGGAKPNLNVMGLTAAANDTSVGYAVGGQIDYALTSNISIFTATRYYHLGGKSLTATLGGIPVATSTTPFDFLTQTAGLSFKF